MALPEAMGAWTMAADSMIAEKVPFAMESNVCGGQHAAAQPGGDGS